MRLFRRLWAYIKIFPRARHNRSDLVRLLVRRPAIALAVSGYETGLLFSNRLDERLKVLATVKTSSLIGCPF